MTNKRKETDSLGVVEVPGDQPLDYPAHGSLDSRRRRVDQLRLRGMWNVTRYEQSWSFQFKQNGALAKMY
jgi:hypothetical protein